MAKRSASHVEKVAIEQSVRESLREAGLRCTPARMAVLHRLREANAPLSHAEVADQLDLMGVDKATVLRNLADLVEAGLARRTEVGDRLWRYEPLLKGESNEPHPHFLCVDCGSIQCIEKLQLSPVSRKHSETIGEVTEILLKGRCKACLAR